ncbi:uncharacterized protein EV420DRAFT_1543191 [Desarmillaria tabescens]|uniref:Uncharacterized protein n=1 Tax=Armillaria tabescens TaxID=1929756 RepID=A0AA39N5U7_ARMTA|nr:uncharacterized protein EV420DRAFT_1543191 [Desarmillaria tabescens]KAK0458568.1 hypothetical protein EV420DRAFT_1543191 [Desarmillaria tabescens]
MQPVRREPPTVARSPTTPEPEWFDLEAPQVLKTFLEDVERGLHPSGQMSLKLDPDCKSWVYDHIDAVSEHFPGKVELIDNEIFVRLESATHEFLKKVLFNAFMASRGLGRQLYINSNISYPIVEKGFKILDIGIYAQDPTEDLWPLFLMEIAYSDLGWKSLRDVLKVLLGCNHKGDIRGALALKISKRGEDISKITYNIVAFTQDGTIGDKHGNLNSFQPYAKVPHEPGMGKWIPTDGEHFERKTKYRMFRQTNDSGGRYFSDGILVDHGIIDEDHTSSNDDIVLDPEYFNLPADSERLCLRAKDLWFHVRHQEVVERNLKRKKEQEKAPGRTEKRRKRIPGPSTIERLSEVPGTWDDASSTFKPA